MKAEVTEAATSHSLWQLIDGVVVINLDRRPDRWTQFQQAATGIIPPEKLHRLPACWGQDLPGYGQRPWFRGGQRDRTWAARAGCVLSHRAALRHAQQAGWRTALILEDDVAFVPEFSTLAAPLARALREQTWQVCYLGFTDPWPPHRQLTRLDATCALHQIHGATTTHAYLLRETARDWVLHQLPDETRIWPWLAAHRAIDRWYQRHLGLRFPVACVSPSVVNQTGGFSDIAEQIHHTRADDGLARTVLAASAHGLSYCLRQMLRRITIRVGIASDAVHGWIRRQSGF